MVCRAIRLNIREFYDHIYIPINFFRHGDWDVRKVLEENRDVLFYNEKYLAGDDIARFDKIFGAYADMIEEIMSGGTNFFRFLDNWTDVPGRALKSICSRSYLRGIILCKKYWALSPAYIADLYCDLYKKYKSDSGAVKAELERTLDGIVSQLQAETKEFKKNFRYIVDSYVYECPLDDGGAEIFALSFVNSIMMEILDFVEKLIGLRVYAVHPIILGIIDYYLPLDEINQFDPEQYGGRKYRIV